MNTFIALLFLGIIFIVVSTRASLIQSPGSLGDTYWLIKSSDDTSTQLTDSNIQELIDPTTEKVVFLIHGMDDNKNIDWYHLLTSVLLTRFTNWNVIQVDWKDAAKASVRIFDHTITVGNNVGGVISWLDNIGISGDKILMIGQSLGAHVAGFAGKTSQKLNNTISRIVTLDAGGLICELMSCEHRLCKTDAKFLSVIHTDAGGYGMKKAIGHADFYPNNGFNQPGCGNAIFTKDACCHRRSWQFFIEGVQYPDHFTSTKCLDYNTFITNRELCGNITSHMGDLESFVEGVFYLQTNAESPFSIY